jgi:hypothetical protein
MLAAMRNPFSRKQSASAPAQPVSPLDEQADILARVQGLVWPGFHTRDEVVAQLSDGATGELAESARRLVDLVWAERAAELADAPDGGDCDRLREAFAALAEAGVLARMHFSISQEAGARDIAGERSPLASAAGEPGRYPYAEWAYTFFHAQDSARLAGGDATLMLSFSSFVAAPDADPADIAAGRAGDTEAMRRVMEHTDTTVGRLVVAALVDAGLTVTWDGTAAQRIAVSVPQWRKPLPG